MHRGMGRGRTVRHIAGIAALVALVSGLSVIEVMYGIPYGQKKRAVEMLQSLGVEREDYAVQLMRSSHSGDMLTAVRLICAGVEQEAIEAALLEVAVQGHATMVPMMLCAGGETVAAEALELAARHGHVDTVLALLKNPKSYAGDVEALQLAATYNHLSCVEILLDAGVPIERDEAAQESPLLAAAAGGHTEIVSLLVQRGANLMRRDEAGRTALKLAAAHHHHHTVHCLAEAIEKHLSLATEDIQLPEYAAAGNEDQVKNLLMAGANVNARDLHGDTALMLATKASIRHLLLAEGADPYMCNAEGKMWPEVAALLPGMQWSDMAEILECCFSDEVENKALAACLAAPEKDYNDGVVMALLEAGARPADGGVRLLNLVTRYGCAETLSKVLTFCKEVNHVDEAGRNAAEVLPLQQAGARAKLELLVKHGLSQATLDKMLFAALGVGDVASVECLLQQGANPNAEDAEGKMVLVHLMGGQAERTQQTACVRLLLQKDLQINKQPPSVALSALLPLTDIPNRESLLQQLVSAGADVNQRNPEGVPLLREALDAGDISFAGLMLQAGASPRALDGNNADHLVLALQNTRQEAAVAELLEMLSDPNREIQEGKTPLLLACLVPEQHALTLALIQAGANVHYRAADGSTLLMQASQVPGNKENMSHLLTAGADALAWDAMARSALNYYVKGDENRHFLLEHVGKSLRKDELTWEQQSLNVIRISIKRQRLQLFNPEGKLLLSKPVSTGIGGIGSRKDSKRTPVGRFYIYQAVGAGMPTNMMFKKMSPMRRVSMSPYGGALMTTRLLALHGLDRGNANTRWRGILIHGTNKTTRIGNPASGGCIRMNPKDILELFPLAPAGTRVIIE